MPRRRRPKPEIIEYKILKAASGGGGGGGGGGFQPGQNLVCRVVCEEPGGYSIWISKYNLPGFLPTQALLRTGEEILAQFVCVHNHRVLVSARFSNNVSRLKLTANARWEEHLDELNFTTSSHEIETETAETAETVKCAERAEKTPTCRSNKMKRASDLFPPPLTASSLTERTIEDDDDLEWLITDIEGGSKTGCVKAFCERTKSRSAMLLNRGRVVGCLYSLKSKPETEPTEQSLTRMLVDLALPGTKVHLYDLPENIVAPMSALFIGYPIMRNDNYDAREYFDYIYAWLERKKLTGCIAISLRTASSTCLGFVFKGKFGGAFHTEDERFSSDKKYIYELLRSDLDIGVEASALLDVESTAARFRRSGFSLSVAKAQINSCKTD